MRNRATIRLALRNQPSQSTSASTESTTVGLQYYVLKAQQMRGLSDQEADALLDLGTRMLKKKPSVAFLYAASCLMQELWRQRLKEEPGNSVTSSLSYQEPPSE